MAGESADSALRISPQVILSGVGVEVVDVVVTPLAVVGGAWISVATGLCCPTDE